MSVQALARFRADEGVFSDVGGTTPQATNNGAVASWHSSADSALSILATQSVAGRQPVLLTSDGGSPSISFSSDVLVITHSASWVLTAVSWLAVFEAFDNSISNDLYFWSKGGTSWVNPGLRFNYSADVFNPENEKTAVWHCGAYNAGRNHRLSLKRDRRSVLAATGTATRALMWVNQQAISRRAFASGTLDWGTQNLTIGAGGDATTYAMITLRLKEIAWWNSELTESQMSTEISDAMTRWTVTNEIEPPSSSSSIIVVEDD